jgi:hypothetical protein
MFTVESNKVSKRWEMMVMASSAEVISAQKFLLVAAIFLAIPPTAPF